MEFANLLDLGSKVSAIGILLVFCIVNWKELRGVRIELKAGNSAVQEILVKALTGELRSYDRWLAERKEPKE